jgi:hypothetical protein
MMETQATTHCCLEPFQWEFLCGWDFRPQLIVVSSLFGGNPFVDGILGHNLLLSQAFSVGIPLWMGFRLSRSLFHKLFFFSQWNSGYQEALHTNFFFFHDGILAIKESFTRTFSFFTMEFWLSGSLSHDFFSFFTMGFWLSGSLLHELFSFFTMGFSRCTIWGKFLFIYIYIIKSIYIGSASLKTLPLDLDPHLQGKEYGPPYSNASKRRKAIVFSRTQICEKGKIL